MTKKRLIALCALAAALALAGITFAALGPTSVRDSGRPVVGENAAGASSASHAEPAAMVFLGAGLLGAAAFGRRRFRD